MTNIYQAYQQYVDATDPLRASARAAAPFLGHTWPGLPSSPMLRKMAAAYEVFARTQLTHVRPPFAIDSVLDGGRTVAVREEVIDRTPFCTLLRFRKETAAEQPAVLLVAPMSGHFATLLRGTVKTLLRDHDVYITDWHNARDIALEHGRFGLDEYVGHLIRFLQVIGPGAHLVAVCQPTVAAITAAAVMAEGEDPAQPRTMTLMAGPLDTRVNPTTVNELAKSKPIEWFEKNLVSTVPARHPGGGRKVYPGFMQLAAFMNMNLNRHVDAFRNLYTYLIEDEHDKAEAIKVFYEEYFAMSDLPAEFYLETVRVVFQEHALPLGLLQFQGRPVNLKAIRRTALFTVEGEKDDICAVGQTVAAQDMCSSIRPYMRLHHVQTAVGHYGVFNGRRWENEIYPRLRDFINMHHR
ncbi:MULTISPECIES: polyhydroxyalkanoate depolymerase [unclassified Herbaspirillum]|uniref:polyhydroxyalkanoate depolymerase n=1 Tax=unclassified Herbaspirillum TaxID=2624150 RepID=UPI000E2F54DE|nr:MULTISPECIES: polyhydroxyalkanoate depolymerase [unclassified Herbaspirillum]RFB70701.1 polyhydroxyalkanoate depolymerase [Herbaspirillum sp. 3R-3a1]TFI08779.1 polyhydroxyalkanoate depolymerase [Herbaspirillum sp. 3R11]TFI15194.1 polyhydroxyalkanoate depolymerase [Herbaspirillum sp. 3R-11]TFI24951.1 polyhydroxyalkanoate depolymerase [Herbaspirillum sp. 3C11]